MRAQEGRDAAPRNREDISVAENLSNDAQANKATPFFVFCPYFYFVERCSFGDPITTTTTTTTTITTERRMFSDAKARRLCSPNKKNQAQT